MFHAPDRNFAALDEIFRVGVLALLLLGAGPVFAQDKARERELEELRGTVQKLEKTLEEVRGKLNTLEQKEGVEPSPTPPPPPTPTPTSSPKTASDNQMVIGEFKIDLPQQYLPSERSPIPDYDTVMDQQPAAPRPDNEPIDPELKGFIPIPGTKSMIRFGGSPRLDAIVDFGDNGNPNQFIPSTIPVEGQAFADGGERATIHAKGTRLTFEVRRPVGQEGSLRIYYENDFFGNSASSGMDYRVRHFYGQAWNLLVGQTFSTFMNIDAWPDVLDYAGPNAIMNRRQPQIRYSPPIYNGVDQGLGKMHLMFSLEQPGSDLNMTAQGIPVGARPITRAPDGVTGWRWEGGVGHVQLAGLFRALGYEVDTAPDETVFGWGANASGAFNVFTADKITWQAAYGEGMARYVNDIGGALLDAAPDTSGGLDAIAVFATTAGYMHEWSEHFRSTLSYGYVYADAPVTLGPFALENTHYATGNLVWHPVKPVRVGVEYLFGRREAQNTADGYAHRINLVLRYDLIR